MGQYAFLPMLKVHWLTKSDVYQEIGDTGDLEELDRLMDGQSHRAQLSATIREHGGQSYANSAAADDNFLRNAGRNPGRDSRHGGRGGGVIGSRGRNSSLHRYAAIPMRIYLKLTDIF